MSGFRDRCDNDLFPDGIDLTLSGQLAEVARDRDWLDLVEAKLTSRATVGPPASTERDEIKTTLGIPL